MEHKPTHRWVPIHIRWGSLALLAAAACCARCSRPADATFARHTLMEWVRQSDDGKAPSHGSSAPALYVDASASMRGFTDPGGTFEYSRALRALQSAAEQLDAAQPLRMIRVDAGTRELTDPTEAMLAMSRLAAFYNGTVSNVAATIRSFGVAAAPAARRRIEFFITDGVQSLPHTAADPRCAAGADPRCVNAAIGALIDRGWGAHVFAIRSRFSGPVYSEIHGGGPAGIYRAVDPASPERFRPFLLFIFTEDPDQLEGLVAKVRDNLESAAIDHQLIHELPLTVPLVQQVRLKLDTECYTINDPLAVDAPKPNPLILATDEALRVDYNGQPLREDVQVLRYSGRDINFLLPGAVRITSSIELTPAGKTLFGNGANDAALAVQRLTVREIARPQSWYAPAQSLAWPPQGYQLKHLEFGGTVTDEVSKPLIYTAAGSDAKSWPSTEPGGHLSLKWSQTGDYLPLVLLQVEVHLNPAHLRLPKWVIDWSTDDDSNPADGNQLLNLRLLMAGLQHNSRITRQNIKPSYLIIWPDDRS